jgi:hypothetical protein
MPTKTKTKTTTTKARSAAKQLEAMLTIPAPAQAPATTATYPQTIEIQGQKATMRPIRRYAVVAVRPKPVKTPQGTLVAFARVEKRSDSEEKAIKAAAVLRKSAAAGVEVHVIDRSQKR